MKLRTRALCAALCAVVGTSSSIAAAQSPDRRAEARARANEGLALHKKGDDAGALLKFQQAYALVPLPELLFDLALAEQRTGHLLDAQAHYKKCQADPAFAPHGAEVQQHLDELKGQLGHLKIDAPAQTALTVDGQIVTDWSAPVDVLPGSHTVTATHGWQVTRTVDASAGQEVAVSIAAPPGTATATPPGPNASPSGPAASASTPAAGSPAESSGSSSTRLVVAGTLAGLSLVSLGVGVVFGVQSIGKGNDAATLNGQRGGTPCPAAGASICQSLGDDYSAQKTDSTLAGVLYVSSGVLAAGAVATYLLWPSAAPATASGAWFAPSVSPAGASLTVGARF